MPLQRRTVLAALALSPLAIRPTGGTDTDPLAVDWRTTVDEGRLIDSARVDGQTVLLTDSSGESATVHAVDDDGSRAWSRQLDAVPSAEAITGSEDGGVLVAGRIEDDDRVVVARLAADRTISWQHRVAVGYHDRKTAVHPLDDDRVAVVSNSIGTHAVSARLQCIDPSGTVRWDHTRDGFAATITDVVDGDLLAGGYAFKSEFGGWLDRIDTQGQHVWERRWEEYTDAAGFGPGGGVAASGVYEDDGTDAWRIRYLSADGQIQREWRHNFVGDERASPRVALRLSDGSAVFVDERGGPGPIRLLRTDPQGSPDSVVLDPFDAAAPHDLFAVDDGVLLTGDFESASDGGSWVVRLAEPGTQTKTRTTTQTTQRPETPTTDTDTVTSQETTDSTATATEPDRATTGESGPGFGPLAALSGIGTAALAKLRDDEKRAD